MCIRDSSNIAINGTGNLTITHGGTIDLDAQNNELLIKDNSATALVVKQGSATYLSFVTTNSSEALLVSKTLDINGNKLVLDTDGDTSITADTDDEIHFELAGADKYKLTASAFVPASSGGVALGTSSLKFGAAFVDNIKIDGNAITSENTDGNISITPNGAGKVVLDGLSYPTSDGTADQVLKTDGSGNLSFGTVSTSFTLVADSGSNDTFNTGENLTFTGGSAIATAVSNNTITTVSYTHLTLPTICSV